MLLLLLLHLIPPTSLLLLISADFVTGFDVDPDALATFQQNLEEFEMEQVELSHHVTHMSTVT